MPVRSSCSPARCCVSLFSIVYPCPVLCILSGVAYPVRCCISCPVFCSRVRRRVAVSLAPLVRRGCRCSLLLTGRNRAPGPPRQSKQRLRFPGGTDTGLRIRPERVSSTETDPLPLPRPGAAGQDRRPGPQRDMDGSSYLQDMRSGEQLPGDCMSQDTVADFVGGRLKVDWRMLFVRLFYIVLYIC